MILSRPIFTVFIMAFSYISIGQQPEENWTLFTISVAAPTKAKDVQVRYLYSGGFGGHRSSMASATDDNQIVIKPVVEDASPKTLRLVAFAPGCQFVTISVDDLSANRQGQFQCRPLSTLQFNGRVDVSALGRTGLKVEVLYSCDWCPRFLGMGNGALSPMTIARADVGSDGTFLVDLPDFSADPLWSTFSNSASLLFYARDGQSGEPVASLLAQSALSKSGSFPVAASYPEVEFKIQPQDAAASVHH